MANTVRDLVRYLQDKHYAGDENSLADSESVGCALQEASDLDKAKLALALLESIRPTISARTEEDIAFYIDCASKV